MKKLLAMALLLAACGSNKSKPATTTTDTPTTDTPKTTVVTAPANPAIATTKKFGNLEIAGADFDHLMVWDQAVAACKELGDGWRLPTPEEQKLMYQKKDSLAKFTSDLYWNSVEVDTLNAGTFNFFKGKEGTFSKVYDCRARAVRTF
jgi:ABC-type Fe3+-hydroxamate transport system substrate-binding protein